jgi:hypothetical protein
MTSRPGRPGARIPTRWRRKYAFGIQAPSAIDMMNGAGSGCRICVAGPGRKNLLVDATNPTPTLGASERSTCDRTSRRAIWKPVGGCVLRRAGARPEPCDARLNTIDARSLPPQPLPLGEDVRRTGEGRPKALGDGRGGGTAHRQATSASGPTGFRFWPKDQAQRTSGADRRAPKEREGRKPAPLEAALITSSVARPIRSDPVDDCIRPGVSNYPR